MKPRCKEDKVNFKYYRVRLKRSMTSHDISKLISIVEDCLESLITNFIVKSKLVLFVETSKVSENCYSRQLKKDYTRTLRDKR